MQTFHQYVIIINDGHVYQNIEKYSNNMYMHISIKRLKNFDFRLLDIALRKT